MIEDFKAFEDLETIEDLHNIEDLEIKRHIETLRGNMRPFEAKTIVFFNNLSHWHPYS